MFPTAAPTPTIQWDEPVRHEDLGWRFQLEGYKGLLVMYAVIAGVFAIGGFVFASGGYGKRLLGAFIGVAIANVIIGTLGLGAFILGIASCSRAASKPTYYYY